jgi:hypothetical protein
MGYWNLIASAIVNIYLFHSLDYVNQKSASYRSKFRYATVPAGGISVDES